MASDMPPFPPRGQNPPPTLSNALNNHASSPTDPTASGDKTAGGGGGNIPITLEEFLKVGSVMKATTVHGVVHQGEILAVDNKTKLAFMAVPCGTGNGKTSSGDSAKHNIVMLNLNTLQALDNIKEPPQDSNDALAQLTSCRPQDAEDRLRLSVAGKKKRVESVGVGVSPQAQTLFDKLSMQYSCSWFGTAIKIDTLNVTVHPPYYSSDNNCVKGMDLINSHSIGHVKKVVENIWLKEMHQHSSSNNHRTTSQPQPQTQVQTPHPQQQQQTNVNSKKTNNNNSSTSGQTNNNANAKKTSAANNNSATS